MGETVTTVTSPSHEPSQPRKAPRTGTDIGDSATPNRQASNDGTGNDDNPETMTVKITVIIGYGIFYVLLHSSSWACSIMPPNVIARSQMCDTLKTLKIVAVGLFTIM